MKIAILGGKFDPPHNGHLLVAKQVLENFANINQIWLLPANTHPWKKMQASGKDRLRMTKYLTTDKIKVSNIDIIRGGNTYTIDTVNFLKQKYNHQFYWIIGSDNLANFKKWKRSQELKKEIEFIVFERAGFETNNLPKGFLSVKSNHLLINNYSSEAIRSRIAQELSIKGLVPEKVEEYIIKNSLYK